MKIETTRAGFWLLAAALLACGGDDAPPAADAAPAADAVAAPSTPPSSAPPAAEAAPFADTALADSLGGHAPAGSQAPESSAGSASSGHETPSSSDPAPRPSGPAQEPRTADPDPGIPPTVSAPAQDPDTETILRATGKRYENLLSVQARFEQELENTMMGSTVRSKGVLYQRQPDRFLMRFTEPEGDVIVSDGRYFWIYFPSADVRQVIRSRRGAQGLDLRSQFIGDPVERFEATYHGREAVGGRMADVLTLVPREPVGYRKLKVWIDAADRLVRRFELTEENGNIRRIRLNDLVVNPSLPDSLFEFTPPANAVIVDRG